MKVWHFIVLGMAALAVSGCRTDPRITCVERQNRMLEDENYRLRDEISNLQTALESAPSLETDASRPVRPEPERSSQPEHMPAPQPEVEIPGADTSADRELDSSQAPSLPQPIDRERSTPGGGIDRSAPLDDAPRWSSPDTLPDEPPAAKLPGTSDTTRRRTHVASLSRTTADSSQVTHLLLNGPLTGGYRTQGRPGDGGIMVVLEPCDDAGRSIEAAADVSVVVLDPALPGEQSRVARWDFTAAEISDRFRNAGPGRGIELQLQWPKAPPVNERLHLFVRYTTSDGRKLQADRPIEIDLDGKSRPGWVATQKPATERQLAPEPKPAAAQAQLPLPAPVVQLPTSPPHRMAARPAEPKSQRPVWSPNR